MFGYKFKLGSESSKVISTLPSFREIHHDVARGGQFSIEAGLGRPVGGVDPREQRGDLIGIGDLAESGQAVPTLMKQHHPADHLQQDQLLTPGDRIPPQYFQHTRRSAAAAQRPAEAADGKTEHDHESHNHAERHTDPESDSPLV